MLCLLDDRHLARSDISTTFIIELDVTFFFDKNIKVKRGERYVSNGLNFRL